MANKSHEVTTDKVKAVVAWAKKGVSQERIAASLGICVDTLIKYYGEEIRDQRPAFACNLEAVLNSCALDPDPKHNVLRIFMAKVVLGYRETVAIDPTKEAAVDGLSDDVLRRRIAERARAARDERHGDTRVPSPAREAAGSS